MRYISCPIKDNAGKRAQALAIIAPDAQINYGELDLAVTLAERKLIDLGIKSSERVCLIGQPSLDYLISLFALWRMGAIACLINQNSPNAVIGQQCHLVRAKFILTSCADMMGLSCVKIKKIRLQDIMSWDKVSGASLPGRRCVGRSNLKLAQPATLMFTSGSGKAPKAACSSIGNHYYSAKGSNENIPLKSGDRWLISLPLYHVSGIGILFRCLLAGAAMVIPDKRLSLGLNIEKNKVTHISFVLPQLRQLLSKKSSIKTLRKFKAILLGGSAIPLELINEAANLGLPIYVSYGLTEMSSQVATTGLLSRKKNLLRAKILKYRKVSISSEGEILLAGKTLFLGYFKDGAIKPAVDSKGWFHSGDIGYIKNGYLFVKGRKDLMLISGGENIFPEEIEEALYKSGLVEEAMVVACLSKKFGERPVAFIKPKPKKNISRQRIVKYLSQHIVKFKIPDNFYRWPGLQAAGSIKYTRKDFAYLLKNDKKSLSLRLIE